MHFGVKYDLHDVLCEIHESPTNSSVNNHTGLRWHWVAGFSNTLNLVSPLCVRKTPIRSTKHNKREGHADHRSLTPLLAGRVCEHNPEAH